MITVYETINGVRQSSEVVSSQGNTDRSDLAAHLADTASDDYTARVLAWFDRQSGPDQNRSFFIPNRPPYWDEWVWS